MKTRRVLLLVMFLACVLFSACRPSRLSQVNKVKACIPEAKQFVNDNKDFLDVLLAIKDKIFDFNETQAVRSEGIPFENLPPEFSKIEKYHIGIDESQLDFDTYWYTSPLADECSLITEEERILLSGVLLTLPEAKWISIYPDSVDFLYASSGWETYLILCNPAYEREDPLQYSDGFDFTVEVNDDWCICIFNWFSGA